MESTIGEVVKRSPPTSVTRVLMSILAVSRGLSLLLVLALLRRCFSVFPPSMKKNPANSFELRRFCGHLTITFRDFEHLTNKKGPVDTLLTVVIKS